MPERRLGGVATRVAMWWLSRHYREVGPPDPWDCPWVDASQMRSLVIGPGVIQEPGLLIKVDASVDGHHLLQASTVTVTGRDGWPGTLLLGYWIEPERADA